MSEKRPMIPVVEVRETFTPSELLRSELKRFISPELDTETSESLRATFLFKSWRRRIMRRDDYYVTEHSRNGAVYQAARKFEELPPTPITLMDATIADGPGESASSRFIVKAPLRNPFMQAAAILDRIPSLEGNNDTLGSQALLFVELSKSSLMRAGDERNRRLQQLRSKLRDPRLGAGLTIVPHDITIRDTIVQLQATGADAEGASDETQSV